MNTCLDIAYEKPASEISQLLDLIKPTDSVARSLEFDIERHIDRSEFRPRLLRELDIALKNKQLDDEPSACQQLADFAIRLDQKKVAQILLKKMMAAPSLRPRYAKVLRDRLEQDFDDLMWRATH